MNPPIQIPKKIVIALVIYITSLIAANTLGIKLTPFFWDLHFSVAIFSFPVVFLMTDIIGEVYGKEWARFFVISGFVATTLFIFYNFLSLVVPWSKDALWVKDSFNQVFELSIRSSIASIVAFIVAEYQDVLAFFYFKGNVGKKYFWLRSNLSNIWSQFLDTVIFMTIAMAGVYPTKTLISIIISWWLFKVLMGFLYTPLSYVGIYLLKEKTSESDAHPAN